MSRRPSPRRIGVRTVYGPAGLRSGPLAPGDLLGELRHDLEQVAHHAEVGKLEDRRLGVLVDHHDGLGRLHAGPVLDRARDADRQVQLRRHGLAGLADLELVRVPAGVGGRAGRTDRRAQPVRQPSISAKFSALPTPRPPDTTMDASVSSGRSLRSAMTRSVMCAPLAASLSSTVTCSSAASPGAASGGTAFGRTATIGMPPVTGTSR